MRPRLVAALAALLGTTACLDPLEVPNGRIGMIVMDTYEMGPDYVVSPIATFYHRTNSTFKPATADSCFISPFNSGGQTIALETMDVGDALSINLPGTTETLTPITEFGYTYYHFEPAAGIQMTPGDTVEVQVPGRTGAYPPVNIRVRSAEVFDHSAIPVPADGEDIAVTWDPAPLPGAIMSFSLRYAVAPSEGLLNQQLFCAFADDGAHTIPWGLLAGWRNSILDTREVKATRMRYSEVTVDSRTQLAFISTFSRPTPTPP